MLEARINGNTARDKASFMDTIAEALNFPDYFGANWDAFAECLNDLSWCKRAVILVVDNSENLLSFSRKDREVFFEIIKENQFLKIILR